MQRTVSLAAAVALGLTGAAALATGIAPIPVSPGGEDRFTAVASPCPTFSWGAVAGAIGYELVVYEVHEEAGAAPAAVAAPELDAAPVIRQRIPGPALTWTPPNGRCLDLARSYVWSVRALGQGAGGGWSAGSLFRVEPDRTLAAIGEVVERALERYLERRGVRLETGEGFAAELAREIDGAARPAQAGAPAEAPEVRRARYAGGRRLLPGDPAPRGVFGDEVELWLAESGSGASDKVQLVFSTPEFDGSPSDAWAIVVEAEDSSTAGSDAGKMFFNTPSFFDALQLFTDGTAIIGDLREFRILPSASPPIACTSFLQEGMLYWDSTIGALCACDGSSWKTVDADETGSCV